MNKVSEKIEQKQRYEDEIDVLKLVRFVYTRKKLIAKIVIFCAICSVAYNMLKPAMYEASATFFPINIKDYYEGAQEGLTMKSHLDIEDLIISILNSRTMSDRIIEELDLKNIWKKKFNVDARKILRKMTKITLEKNGIIKLTARDRSPDLPKKMADAYINNIEYFNTEIGISADRKIVQIIDRAVLPEKTMPRGIIKYTVLTILISFVSCIIVLAFIEFLKLSKTT